MSSLRQYISFWDPLGFVSNGAPSKEYDIESDEIVRRFSSKNKTRITDAEIGKLIYKVFIEFTDLDPIGFKEECFMRATDVKKILLDS